MERIKEGLIVINQYNLRATSIGGCMDDENGAIIFCKMRESIDAISENEFSDDFESVLMMTDKYTAQIFKNTINVSKDSASDSALNHHQEAKSFLRRLFS